jgi:hypothetical protein
MLYSYITDVVSTSSSYLNKNSENNSESTSDRDRSESTATRYQKIIDS